MTEPFRPNIFQSAPRADSEPQQPPARKSHLHSLHHHTHRHHHHHHHRRHSPRHHAKEAVQSAIQLHPPTSFGDLLKQAKGKDSSSSTLASRRESVQEGKLDGQSEAARRDEVPEEQSPIRPADVEREQRGAKAREEELRSSLQSLSDQSIKTSRRLDDTYYSILEKVSVLQQTIGSLQELSSLTKELHENFESDTQELVEDIRGQFDGFHDFEAQQEQVAILETRIKAGKEKAQALNLRLEEAKKRVDARAKSEAELEARNTRRIRILWGILSTIAGLIFLAILFQQFKPIHLDGGHRTSLDFSSRSHILDAPIPNIAKEAIMSSTISILDSQIETTPVTHMPELKDDHRLRVFDEL